MARLLLLLLLVPGPADPFKAGLDFGLLENEPLLRDLCHEDLTLHSKLLQLNSTNSSPILARFMERAYGPVFAEGLDPVVHVKHPVNSYNLVKRAVVDVKNLVRGARAAKDDQLAEEIEKLIDETTLYKTIRATDMVGAMNGLLMLIHTYKLNIEDLRRGRIVSQQSGTHFDAGSGLDVHDLVVMAQTAEEEGYINTAASLLRSAHLMAKNEDLTDGQVKALTKHRKIIMAKHNGLLKKRRTFLSDKDVVNVHMLDENLEKKKKQPKYVTSGMSRNIDWNILHNHGGMFSELERMLEGCRDFPLSKGEEVPAYKQARQCYHLHHTDPFHRLAPFKLEVASALPDPHIVVIHGMLEEEDIRHWVDWATPRLSRKRDGGTDMKKISAADKNSAKVRTVYKSVQAWKETIVFEGEKSIQVSVGNGHFGKGEYTPDNFTVLDPRAERLSKRLERALALNVTNQWSSHTYQVTNYGLAGTCEGHIDPYGYEEGKHIERGSPREGLATTGDYIGTSMGWLEDTPLGGDTTFFNTGESNPQVTVRPTRGSVAFWFSQYKDGARDQGTSHGGCPVAIGAKWIFNKWIYSFNNWNRYPCDRRPAIGRPHHESRRTWPASSVF